jgi:hypothetical protein
MNGWIPLTFQEYTLMRSMSDRLDGRGLVSSLSTRLLLRRGGLTLILQNCILKTAVVMFNLTRRGMLVEDVSGRIWK